MRFNFNHHQYEYNEKKNRICQRVRPDEAELNFCSSHHSQRLNVPMPIFSISHSFSSSSALASALFFYLVHPNAPNIHLFEINHSTFVSFISFETRIIRFEITACMYYTHTYTQNMTSILNVINIIIIP